MTQEAAGRATPERSYEEARDALVAVVKRLETGGLSLEESLALWQQGEQLADECQRLLDGARQKVGTEPEGADG